MQIHEDTPRGVRERKRQAVRAAIAEVAMALALERGFDALRVEEIARMAEVSPRTFNNYFSSKEEAVVSVAFAHAGELQERLRERPADEDLWEAIGATFASIYPMDAKWQRQVELIRSSPALSAEQLKAHAAIERELAAAIALRYENSVGAQDLYPRLAAAAAAATVRTVTDYYIGTSFDDSFIPTLRKALVQVGTGLSTPGQLTVVTV